MSLKEIFCQDKAILLLQRAYAAKKVPHAYIFAGFIVYVGSYIIAVGFESLRIAFKRGVQFWPGVWVAICLIHVGFGVGFLLNIICRIFDVKIKWFETLSR